MLDWLQPFLPYVAFFSLVFLTYWDVLFPYFTPFELNWVSDDCTMPEADHKPISLYTGQKQGSPSWHNLFKLFRYYFGRIPNPNHNWKVKKQPSYIPFSRSHHRLNLWFFCGVAGLFYLFLQPLVGEKTAFLATLLWIVHPLGGQTVGWISGVNYVASTFFMLIGLTFIQVIHPLAWWHTPMGLLLSFIIFAFWQWMATECLFQTVGAIGILLILHQWPYALIAALFGLHGMANTLKSAIEFRKSIFEQQQMGQSTKFYPRKFIVILKTLYYNIKLALFPKRLGLYHPFCYHYELPYVEHEDRYAIAGIIGLIVLTLGIAIGSFPIQLGCAWFLGFMLIFLNWITANQFVVDRYVWLPAAGFCVIAASYLPPTAFWIVFGIALMRTWTHLPTYDNEEKFYQSNMWNFENSEVAYGNLGCNYMNRGFIGAAMDTWTRGVLINPDYDVCWYNMASMLKTRGPIMNPNYAPAFFNLFPKELLEVAFNKDPMRGHFHLARFCLERSVNAKICHFPDMWKKEIIQLDQELLRPAGTPPRPAVLIRPMLVPALT